MIELCRRDTLECILNSTSALTFTFPGLVPNTSYTASITVAGPGGNQTIPQELVFTTNFSGECCAGFRGGSRNSGRGGGLRKRKRKAAYIYNLKEAELPPGFRLPLTPPPPPPPPKKKELPFSCISILQA